MTPGPVRRAAVAALAPVVVLLAACTGDGALTPATSPPVPAAPSAGSPGVATPTPVGTASGTGSPPSEPGGSASRAVGATGRTAAPRPTARAWGPASARGYRLTAAPAATLAGVRRLAARYRSVYAGVAARTIHRGAATVGTLILLRLRDDRAANSTVERRILPGLVAGLGRGATVRPLRVGRQQIAVARPKGVTLAAWYREGSVVLVLGGQDQAPVLAYSRAYVAAT